MIPISSISLIGSLPTDWQVELSDSTSHIITDAYAGKEYIIQLAAKDMETGTWSDWSVAVHATPWMEEPKPITSTTESDIIPGTLAPSTVHPLFAFVGPQWSPVSRQTVTEVYNEERVSKLQDLKVALPSSVKEG